MDASSLLKEVKKLVPPLTDDKYKGQSGKVGVIGGCREYTGAPFFAAYSALKVGADIAHVFCTPGAATVVKCYSPELIVHPYLPDTADQGPVGDRCPSSSSHDAIRQHAAEAVEAWLDRFDVLVVGPGLGREPLLLETVADVMAAARRRSIPLVIDADGLWLVNQRRDLVEGYGNAVLTPNAMEFRRLAGVLGVDEQSETALQEVCKRLPGPVVVRKGKEDTITDGDVTISCKEEGSPRRAGGQGDVLSGTIAAFVAWAQRAANIEKERLHKNGDEQQLGSPVSPLLLAAYGGCLTTRLASRRAFSRQGRAMGASDVIPELGRIVDNDFKV